MVNVHVGCDSSSFDFVSGAVISQPSPGTMVGTVSPIWTIVHCTEQRPFCTSWFRQRPVTLASEMSAAQSIAESLRKKSVPDPFPSVNAGVNGPDSAAPNDGI